MKRILSFAASVLVAVAAAVTAAPTAAEAAVNDAVIVNYTSNQAIKICKNWGSTSCATASPTCWLNPGENSKTKCKWTDADGYNLTAGWRGCEVRGYPTNYFPAGTCLSLVSSGPKWVQVHGDRGREKFVKVWWVG
jgi:hypothetical protein